MKEVVIVSAVRTPIGSFNGGLASFSAAELGAMTIAEAVKRAQVKPGENAFFLLLFVFRVVNIYYIYNIFFN